MSVSAAMMRLPTLWSVRSATLSRNPRKSTGSPVPPPNATTRKSSYLLTTDQYTVLRRQQDLTPVASRWLTRAAARDVLTGFLAFEVPVPHEEVDLGVALPELPGELLDDDDRAVAPAGAADAQSEVRLAFGGVARDQEREQFARLLQKRRGVVVLEHGVAHRPVVARERPQVGVVVGVRHEPDVEDGVHVERRAVLEAEGDQADREAAREGLGQLLEPETGVQRGVARGVHDQVRLLA